MTVDLGALAAFDLPGCARPAPDLPLDDAAWASLRAAVTAQRLEGALAWAVFDGSWPATPAQEHDAYELHHRAMALALLLERELLDLAARCDDAGIAYRVLKGPAAAHLDETDPSRRAYGDLDLLVRSEDLAHLQVLIEADGGRRRYPEPAPGFDRRWSKGLSFAFERNCEIDVHRTLASGAFGLTIDLDDLFAHRETFRLATSDLPALDRSGRFLHACYHAILGGSEPRLNAVRDLVHTAPEDAATTRVVLERARRWQAEPVVATAVTAAVHHVGWDPPLLLAAWARGFRPTSRDRRWLAAYVGDQRSYAAQMLTGIEALPSARDRVAYARANARPGGHRLRRGLTALRQLSRR